MGRRSDLVLPLAGLLLAACGADAPVERPGAAPQAVSTNCVASAPLPMPPPPRLLRDVAQVSADGSTPTTGAPPALRTTRDGRIGLNVKMGSAPGSNVYEFMKLFLLSPEKAPAAGALGLLADELSIDLAHLGAGVIKQVWNGGAFPSKVEIRHATLCGAASSTVIAAPDGANDVYDLTLIGFNDITSGQTQTWQVDVHLVITQPKTAQAAIDHVHSKVVRVVEGPTLSTIPIALEPMITSDGQLLVARTGGGVPFAGFKNAYNIFYAYSPSDGGFCDVARFATDFQPKPILYAPHDPALRTDTGAARYGFAARPMRDPTNQRLVTDAQAGGVPPLDIPELAGTYPWIDREGRNLFFYAVGATNSFPGSTKTRFPTTCNAGTCTDETRDGTRGLSVVGSWTNGKAVLLDGLINNIDFGYGIAGEAQRTLQLYAAGSDVRFASGRDNGVTTLGDAIDNITIVDSLENLENGTAAWRPRTRRDVVWKVSRGAVSDEVAFDDFLDPNVFLYAPMNGVVNLANGRYLDGFAQPDPSCTPKPDGTFLDGAVRVQNAATMPAEMGSIPAAGTVSSGVRIEPAALGGIHGRGLYLPAGASLQFPVANHDQASSRRSWYAGFFVDGADAGQALSIAGRFSVSLTANAVSITPTGQATRTVTTAAPILGAGWAHVGLLVQVEGTKPSVAVYVNGDLAGTVTWPLALMPAFYPDWPDQTALTLSPSRSWVDELKVILNAGWMRGVPEIPCNHARGSMVQATDGTSACRRAADDGTVAVGAQEISLREAQTFGGAALVASQPRPDFSQNPFCTSCHVPSASDPERPQELGPGALTRLADLRLDQDTRRQPLVPPRQLLGNIPAGTIDAAPTPSPTAPQVCTSLTSTCNVDDYLFP